MKPKGYGRGVGYDSKDKCVKHNLDKLGCEKYGLLWYPKCKPNFHHFGCCLCTPDCPSDTTDVGASCTKESYSRGAGSIMGCGTNEDKQGALCYPKCKSGYYGVGPVCWEKCPNDTKSCGA